ncbi:MBL fold metallo-hydrolase [Candidatus Woesebacteria bacterium]|nr:MBL fold metallo-hydrolase [Candidatus Woesebacteria bacterium]
MNNFNLTVFDVEHGNSIVLKLPNANDDRFLFDIGNRADFSPALHLARNYGSNIRWLVITHPDTDHISDVEYVSKYLSVNTLSSHDEITTEFLYEYHVDGIPEIVQKYIEYKKRFNLPAPPIEDPSYDWGGVQFAQFWNTTKDFSDINNLSICTFAMFQGWCVLLPGDLEEAGWKKHLESEAFREMLKRTDIYVASHHGRENGYCADVFNYCTPHLVIISDKGVSETSCTDKYAAHTYGLKVSNLGTMRKVLTTRYDGAINLNIDAEGKYVLKTFSTS